MIAFFLNVLIIIGAMWLFFRYMYPKPPKAFFAKAGDDVSLRVCDHCGTSLATYRGIFIPKTLPPDTEEAAVGMLVGTLTRDEKGVIVEQGYFFCNQEHQAAFCVKSEQNA